MTTARTGAGSERQTPTSGLGAHLVCAESAAEQLDDVEDVIGSVRGERYALALGLEHRLDRPDETRNAFLRPA